MWKILVSLLFLPICVSADDQRSDVSASALSITNESKTGTLLFHAGDCLAVKVFTQSPYTHVAMLCYQGEECYVYDSANGDGVRKQLLLDYLNECAPENLTLLHPQRELDSDEVEKIVALLESQLGRPYSIHHHVTGKRAKGLHCAEYVTDALMAIDWLHADHPSRVSPASLRNGVLQHEIYSSGSVILVEDEAPPKPVGGHWYEQLWLDTKHCTQACGTQLKRWFLCTD